MGAVRQAQDHVRISAAAHADDCATLAPQGNDIKLTAAVEFRVQLQ
jgi:hypothetical protein